MRGPAGFRLALVLSTRPRKLSLFMNLAYRFLKTKVRPPQSTHLRPNRSRHVGAKRRSAYPRPSPLRFLNTTFNSRRQCSLTAISSHSTCGEKYLSTGSFAG